MLLLFSSSAGETESDLSGWRLQTAFLSQDCGERFIQGGNRNVPKCCDNQCVLVFALQLHSVDNPYEGLLILAVEATPM